MARQYTGASGDAAAPPVFDSPPGRCYDWRSLPRTDRGAFCGGSQQLMLRVRVRLIVTVALLVTATFGLWAWETQVWGARYRPWDQAAAATVDAAVTAVDARGYNAMIGAQADLVGLGPGAVRPLLRYLTHANPQVRLLATVMLGHLGDWSVREPLIGRLTDPHPDVRRQATLALHRLALEGAVHELQLRAGDSNTGARAAVALALGDVAGKENVVILIGLLADESGTVRNMAAVSLGRIGDPRAVPALVLCLGDARRPTRIAAAHSLGMITGLPVHGDGNLWMAWWALHHET